jgi:hypothetical protein
MYYDAVESPIVNCLLIFHEIQGYQNHWHSLFRKTTRGNSCTTLVLQAMWYGLPEFFFKVVANQSFCIAHGKPAWYSVSDLYILLYTAPTPIPTSTSNYKRQAVQLPAITRTASINSVTLTLLLDSYFPNKCLQYLLSLAKKIRSTLSVPCTSMEEDTQQLVKVLQAMKQYGFTDIGASLARFFSTADRRVTKHVVWECCRGMHGGRLGTGIGEELDHGISLRRCCKYI